MTRLTGGLWLLAVAGLAVLLTIQAGWLRVNLLHCVGQSGLLRLTPEQAVAMYPPPSLASAWLNAEWLDLATFLASMMIFAIGALMQQGMARKLMVTATLGLAALLFWHMQREFSGLCSMSDRVHVGIYIWPALLLWMLSTHFGKLLEQRAQR